ncbi:unnamed protein product [Larinioides sclopetarius]|uniref:Uncharacterized protein n=1 Tax=Larinioides sclopetarius TaxID=280406 RepID=A0AAV1Z9F7_9ARAC
MEHLIQSKPSSLTPSKHISFNFFLQCKHLFTERLLFLPVPLNSLQTINFPGIPFSTPSLFFVLLGRKSRATGCAQRRTGLFPAVNLLSFYGMSKRRRELVVAEGTCPITSPALPCLPIRVERCCLVVTGMAYPNDLMKQGNLCR